MRSTSVSLVGRGQNSCAEDRQDSHVETVPRTTHALLVSSFGQADLTSAQHLQLSLELMCGSLLSAWSKLGQDGRHLPMVWDLSGFSG